MNIRPIATLLAALALVACGGNPSALAPAPLGTFAASPSASPQNLTAFSMPGGSVWVRWTAPASAGTWVLARVYRAQTNNFARAAEIGTSRSGFYSDDGVRAGTTYYYWVRFEDDAGNPLGPTASVSFTAEPSVDQQIADLSEDIANDPFAESLRTPITPFHDDAEQDSGNNAVAAPAASGFVHIGANPGARVSRRTLASYLADDARQWPGDRLHRFVNAPTIRLHASVPDGAVPAISATIETINAYLPVNWQMSFDPRGARVSRLDPRDGEIVIEHSPSSRWGAEFQRSVGLALPYGKDSRIDSALIRLDPERAAATYRHTLAHELLHALGRHHPSDPRHVTIMHKLSRGEAPPHLLHPLDAEALTAIYGTDLLEAGERASGIASALESWEQDGAALLGTAGFAVFGIEHRNGLGRPWAYGIAPSTSIRGSLGPGGNAVWAGAMLGFTPEGEGVFGDTALTLSLATLRGRLAFTGLAYEGGGAWARGQLGYAVRAFGGMIQRTGGDEGQLAGGFFGPGHESMGGTLRRSDLDAAFGGTRE